MIEEALAMPKLSARSTQSNRSVQSTVISPKPGRGASGRSPQPAFLNSITPDNFTGIRVLCVDDHAILIEGLRAQFAIKDRIRIVGSLATAANLVEEATRLSPDVVLLDIEMPGPDVFEMADRLRQLHPRVRFIFLSAHIRDGYLAAAYKCGAWGYFAKGDDLEDIVAGVAEVAGNSAGTFVLGPKVRARCKPAHQRLPAVGARRKRSIADSEPATALSSLSPREVAVLRLIGKGLSRTQIAAELSRSAKTIDGHQDRMMKKLGILSRADLIRFAIREGFAEA
jgi:DNA-binding NarL/FixJ family response regulator